MVNIFTKVLGDYHTRAIKPHQKTLERINALEDDIRALSDDELKAKTPEFKGRLESGETLEQILPEAFAVVREVASRTLGERHFDVQLLGGIILNGGNVAEMRTGEGKTLVATLPVYLNALAGKGVHVVTVNDYLARRDAVWMGQIYAFLGLSVGAIGGDGSFIYDPGHKESDSERDELGSFKVVYDFLRPCERHDVYDCDIIYGTNNEFGFDYLRDNLEYDPKNLRQKERHFAVIDEVDSVLIDEARTPLIISAPAADSEKLYHTFSRIARELKEGEDFEIDEKLRAITLTDDGITKAERILGVDNIYTEKGIKYVHHLENAVRAKSLFNKDTHYIVRDGKVVIVDEFTGRLQPGRRWSEGMHQAVEAKEGLEVQRESRTYGSITFQNYFRMYDKISGMTGTGVSSSEEFQKVYGLDTIAIPTNRPVSRIDNNDYIYRSEEGKLKALAREVKERSAKGQPVLIGTVSIDKNEMISEHLRREGIKFEMLNAKNHEREGEIVAQAGRAGAVTVATNMAGRGVDIKLGGNPASTEEYEKVKAAGGLYVAGTERHEARRIDDQLRGRAGRQGDPGETRFYVSLEDSLMRVFASDMIKNMMGRLNIPEDQPIENRIITRSLESAQKKIEGFHFDSRKHVLEFDNVMSKQRDLVYSARRKVLTGTAQEVEQAVYDLAEERSEELAGEIEKKKGEMDAESFAKAFRQVVLQAIDMYWVEHLEVMDYTRQSVNLRAYGQRDPLIEYKKEGFRMFKEMQASVQEEVFRLVPLLGEEIKAGSDAHTDELKAIHRSARLIGGSTASADASKGGQSAKPASAPADPKYANVGRNDPCPCNSGKKFKKCHGQ